MGLSSSQARLLSITARLTDNEYQSQQITNAKLRLTTQSTEAMADYTDALSSEEYYYTGFDIAGNLVKTDFTMGAIYDYAPGKKQYAIKNSADSVLVSQKDAKNFEETNGLIDFLDRYGLVEHKEKTIKNRIYETYMVHNPQYDKDWEEYRIRYGEWISRKPEERIDGRTIPAWTERVHTNKELRNAIMNTGCISYALDNKNCYMHVLASLLGPGNHTTSSGNVYRIYSQGDTCDHGNTWCWNTDQHPVDESIRNQLKTIKCCGENNHTETVTIEFDGNTYDRSTKDFECDEDLTVYQKLVDFLYYVRNDYTIGDSTGGDANPDHLAMFWHFIEFDVDKVEVIEHPEEIIDGRINPEYKEWVEEGKTIVEPTTPETIEVQNEYYVDQAKERLVINDPEKAQWYTNLWYSMNGQTEMIKIKGRDNNVVTEEGLEYEEMEHYLGTDDLTKSESQHYKVVDYNLYKSKEWLSNCLKNGILTMQEVVTSDSFNKLIWSGIMFGNVTEVVQGDNSDAVSRAQAEYESKMSEINVKDQKYQRKLSLLDSEHQALQTEYNSVKSAYEKNVTRSFKIFQG